MTVDILQVFKVKESKFEVTAKRNVSAVQTLQTKSG